MGEGRVSVIGLGEMGRVLASSLLDAGWEVTVWNRTAARADALVERGAVRAGSAAEAVRGGALVLVCLLDYGTVRDVLEPAAGELEGRALVNLTNGTPGQAAEFAAWAAGRGAKYLDGGMMAIPSTLATEEAFIFYSGDESVLTGHRAALEVLGTPHYLGRDTGLAPLYDLALLTAMDMMFAGFHHAVAMALSREGGSAAGVTGHLVPWLTNMARVLPAFAGEVDAHRATGAAPALSQGLDVQRAGALNLIAAAREAGVSTDLLERSRAQLDALLAAGRTDWDSPLSVRQVRGEPLV
ncbi:NAD(P)-dependent oxidoreductase [Streptomyces yaizuensis]|uniref:NAD(P)-binding domain-containing protein n=1 Tax=Streptomyces yaizuensis TaxID=2989713 RepID=A0ABQ5P5S3_9ACTN|nr:NAD(P)-binding domain-containing protein [Streptomyces sp. YSPA8]GLF97938.1 NAD(P)-binding domain-containing protein [Streptomyces sp. YSPA8]